jgi:hypothetical protein
MLLKFKMAKLLPKTFAYPKWFKKEKIAYDLELKVKFLDKQRPTSPTVLIFPWHMVL